MAIHKIVCSTVALAALMVFSSSAFARKPVETKPLMRDFIGLNVHTVQFKPKLYRPAIRMVRDYHPYEWDVGDDTSYVPDFPLARNKVDWDEVYGSWKKEGYDVHVSVMIDPIAPAAWKNPSRDAYAYGFRFAQFFGPSGTRKFVSSMEIGNEPGKIPDPLFRTLFESAAKGIRAADPKMLIVTCNVDTTPSGPYHKSLELFKGLEADYDVINLHTYAQVEGYPSWRRSYPEDPSIPYLKTIHNALQWRNVNAPGKPVWVTEFGYDSTTQPQAKEGDFKQWVGVTDTQQAQYLVRSLLVFSAMDIGRAYIFFFDDNDQASVHGSSGLTRNGVPKPSFYAVAHLQKTLGDYRFNRVVTQKPGDLYVYEYRHATDPKRRIWAVWSPTGKNRTAAFALKGLPGKLVRAERMPLKPGEVERVTPEKDGKELKVAMGESPVYLTIQRP